jgi:hypothetical protein
VIGIYNTINCEQSKFPFPKSPFKKFCYSLSLTILNGYQTLASKFNMNLFILVLLQLVLQPVWSLPAPLSDQGLDRSKRFLPDSSAPNTVPAITVRDSLINKRGPSVFTRAFHDISFLVKERNLDSDVKPRQYSTSYECSGSGCNGFTA